jgi:hypothetical protein
MNSNDTAAAGSSADDRAQAREHLARQIGRLLAREWLQKECGDLGKELREANEDDGEE